MEHNSKKKTVIFICTHNSARSQIAEGLLNALYSKYYKAYSAGTQPSIVNPHAIKVMMEIGIDISNHRSKSVNEFLGTRFDYVVTVCDQAKETCPFFPGGTKNIHKSFEDPSNFICSDDEILNAFRKLRDEIKGWIKKAFGQDINSTYN